MRGGPSGESPSPSWLGCFGYRRAPSTLRPSASGPIATVRRHRGPQISLEQRSRTRFEANSLNRRGLVMRPSMRQHRRSAVAPQGERSDQPTERHSSSRPPEGPPHPLEKRPDPRRASDGRQTLSAREAVQSGSDDDLRDHARSMRIRRGRRAARVTGPPDPSAIGAKILAILAAQAERNRVKGRVREAAIRSVMAADPPAQCWTARQVLERLPREHACSIRRIQEYLRAIRAESSASRLAISDSATSGDSSSTFVTAATHLHHRGG
jgi:hypothetical protein